MNERLNTRGLAELLANQTGMDKKNTEDFIDALALYIAQSLERNKVVKIFGFGIFKILLVRERESIHIQSGKRFIIPAHHKITFTPDKAFKEQINRPFALFEPIEATESEILALSDKTEEENPNLFFEAPEADVQAFEDDSQEFKAELQALDADLQEFETFLQETDDANELPETNSPDNTMYDEKYFELDPAIDVLKYDNEGSYFDEAFFINTPTTESVNENTAFEATVEAPVELPVELPVEPQPLNETPAYESESTPDKKSKRKMMLIGLIFALALVSLFSGGALGTYFFLQHNSDSTAKENSFQNNSNHVSSDDTESPSPLVSVPSSDNDLTIITLISDSDEQSETQSIDNKSVNIQQDEKVDRIWQLTSPDNNRTEIRRADKPNQEIEARNRALRQTQSRNAEATAANNRNTTPATASNIPAASTSNNPISSAKSIKMPAGSGLMQLALEYYGDKVFWVYIYEHNKSRIKNFDNVPAGLELQLPDPKTYGIDPKNATSLNKALQKQRELRR